MKSQLGTKEFNDLAMEMFGGKPKQQTAVEWLVEELEMIENTYHSDSTDYIDSRKNAIELAKYMEKQQMIDFANDLLARNNKNYIALPDLAEQYYNETFKNK